MPVDLVSVISCMPGASAVVGPGPDFTLLAATDDYLQLTGASRAYIGRPLLSAVHAPPQTLAALRISLEKASASVDHHTAFAQPYRFEVPPECGQGALWRMVTRGVPGDSGTPSALVHHLEPCRPGPQADHRSSPLADLGPLEPMFGGAPIGIAVLRGREHRIVYANAVELGLWGRTADQVIGRSVHEALPELVEQGLIQALCDPVLDTGEPVVMTEHPMAFDKPGGERVLGYYNAVHLPIRSPAGEVVGLVAIAWEMTEAVVARRAVDELSAKLAARVDLEQHLIGIVSHDLRNPLNVILLSAQLLQTRTALDPRQAELVQRIVRVTHRSVQLIRDLLDFTEARVGGRIPLQLQPVHLGAILQPVMEQFEVEYPGRVIDESDPELAGHWDPGRIGQAVQNLLSNAVQYGDPDAPVVLSTSADSEGVRVSVHNHGTPIPPERLDTLFEPMRRAQSTRSSAQRNIGMGLYITERIADAHGGRVEVSSSRADGTCFTLWLPVRDS